MVNHGFYNFLNWFDERAWYPLGRIVGGTVCTIILYSKNPLIPLQAAGTANNFEIIVAKKDFQCFCLNVFKFVWLRFFLYVRYGEQNC